MKKKDWYIVLLGIVLIILAFMAIASAQEKSHGKYIIISVKLANVQEPERDALDRLTTRMNIRYSAGYRLIGKIETGINREGKIWGYFVLMEYNPLKRPAEVE